MLFEQSKIFFTEFNKVFADGSPRRSEAVEKYINNSAFTTFIIDEINSIIDTMNYQPQNEYYRIDASGYAPRWNELEKVNGFKAHLWDLKIAVEHENDPKDWLDEVIKLAHIYCPLRVVIGYVPMKIRETEDVKRLKYASKALQMLECKDNLANGEFMVILGNSNTYRKEKNYFNYKAYVLNTESLTFEELEKHM